MTTRQQLEEKWEKLRRVPVTGKPVMLFDRNRRIGLLWQIFFVVGLILFVFCLLAGVR